jgi:tetratricopeptide (TPR) repeat protein
MSFVLALFIATAAPSAEAANDPRQDNIHYREAQIAFDEGRWEDALAALERAYGLDPRPEYLFMQAQVLRTHERCPEAIERYREFIATAPPREDVLSAQAGLQLCGVPQADTAAPVARAPDAPSPRPSPAPDEPPRKRGPDPIAHALIWPGLAIAGVGTGLLVGAHTRLARARREDTEPEFERISRATPAMGKAGIALLSIGGAVLIAGLVRQIVVSRRAKNARSRVALVLVPLWW